MRIEASLCGLCCSHHSSQPQTYHPGPGSVQGSLQGRGGGQVSGLQGPGAPGLQQSRNSVKFASPVRYSANSDICVDTNTNGLNPGLGLPLNGLGPGSGHANLNLSAQTSKETSDALTLRSVASTFPFVEPANGSNGHIGNGGGYHGTGGGYQGGYDPSLLVEDKWNLSGSGSQPQSNGGVGAAGQTGGGQSSQNGNGAKRSYNDNDHYLRYILFAHYILYSPF